MFSRMVLQTAAASAPRTAPVKSAPRRFFKTTFSPLVYMFFYVTIIHVNVRIFYFYLYTLPLQSDITHSSGIRTGECKNRGASAQSCSVRTLCTVQLKHFIIRQFAVASTTQ